MNTKYCFDFTTLLSSNKTFTERDIGRKALILHSLLKPLHNNIPPFSVISSTLYYEFLSFVNIKQFSDHDKIETINTLVNDFFKEHDITKCLNNLTKPLTNFHKLHLALRPSIGAPKHQNLSFSGLLPTFLNVKNNDELFIAIKKIFSTILSSQFYVYLKTNQVKYTDISISIILQQQINPEVSGIAYPYNPITHNQKEITIEAVFGLGDTISNGELIPDLYIINAQTYEIIEKKITPQKWMKIIDHNIMHTSQNTKEIELSDLLAYSQKLDDEHIIELAKLVQNINQDPKYHWLIEWGLHGHKFYLFQVKYLGKKRQVKQQIQKQKKVEEYIPPLLQGLPLTTGEAIGKVVIYKEENTKIPEKTDFILVAKTITPKMLPLITKTNCKGVVLDIAPPNSDSALLLKDLDIPAIGATFYATKILKPTHTIKIVAHTGTIFNIRTKPKTKSSTKKHVIKSKSSSALHDTKNTQNKNKPTDSSKPTKQKTHSKNALKHLSIFEPYNIPGIYKFKQNYLYKTDLLTKVQVERIYKECKQCTHINIVSTWNKRNITSKINNTSNYFSGILQLINGIEINTFHDLTQIPKELINNKQFILLLNLPQLYDTFGAKHKHALEDITFITFVEKVLKPYKNMHAIKLFAQIHKPCLNYLDNIKELGFSGIVIE